MSNVIEVGFKKRSQPFRIWGVDFEIEEGQQFRMNLVKTLGDLEKQRVIMEKETMTASENNDLKGLSKVLKKNDVETKKLMDSVFGEGSYDKLAVIKDDSEYILDAVTEALSLYAELQIQNQGNQYLTGKKG